jgi:signal transduction histidine kinase
VKRSLPNKIRFALAGTWLLLTFSLAAWWMVHGIRTADKLAASPVPLSPEKAARQHRMFFWEGLSLLSFVTAGGTVLIYSLSSDQRRNEEVRRFFSTFTHELKTSLTSLRLQAEILEEDPRNRENENLRRLLQDVVRLELQLENALILAQSDRSRLILEPIQVAKTIEHLSVHWPQLKVTVESDAEVQADQRAFECILKNLLQNAHVHGRATEVKVQARASTAGVRIELVDNGSGFSGDLLKLGTAFVRHTTRSGSGIGIYLSRQLASRMGGRLSFSPASPGLRAVLELRGAA